MRVAGHTYPYRERPLGQALDELQGLGFEDVEVWLGHVLNSPSEAVHELRQRDVRVAALSAGGFYDPDLSTAERAFAVAAELGAPKLVACVVPELLPQIAERAPQGIRLCVENHWDQPLATPVALRRALEGVASVGACLDTGHAILAGIQAHHFAAALGGPLAHVHLKEARSPGLAERLLGRRLRRRLMPRPQPVFPGRGDLDLSRLLSVLKRHGYAGTVTLEYEGPEPTAALAGLLAAWKAAAPDP